MTRRPPFLTGRSIARIGARHSTLIIYPIRNNVDAADWYTVRDAFKAAAANGVTVLGSSGDGGSVGGKVLDADGDGVGLGEVALLVAANPGAGHGG